MTFSNDPALNTNQLPISLDVIPDEKDFHSILLLYLRRVANAMNSKESGLFLLQENAPFEQWYQIGNPQQNRNAYRITVDLVYLNNQLNSVTTIPTGTTPLTLNSNPSTPPVTQPLPINGYLYPVQGFGGAVDTTGLSYFLNDPSIYVRYNSSTNTIIIQNNSGYALTWCVWVQEYLKN
jgi:hypothetical protein